MPLLPSTLPSLFLPCWCVGMRCKQHFSAGRFSMDMKLPKGNSGGTIMSFYLMDTISKGVNSQFNHSEIDIEFYGNTSSNLIQLSTNVFTQGHQNLAQVRLRCMQCTKGTSVQCTEGTNKECSLLTVRHSVVVTALEFLLPFRSRLSSAFTAIDTRHCAPKQIEWFVLENSVSYHSGIPESRL